MIGPVLHHKHESCLCLKAARPVVRTTLCSSDRCERPVLAPPKDKPVRGGRMQQASCNTCRCFMHPVLLIFTHETRFLNLMQNQLWHFSKIIKLNVFFKYFSLCIYLFICLLFMPYSHWTKHVFKGL